jgi:uncharacterized protein YkwD
MEHNYFGGGMESGRGSDALPKFILPILVALLPALYFTKELSSLDTGLGGEDWRIGAPLATLSNGYQRRSLPELQAFALTLVNRDRTVNGMPSLTHDVLLSRAAQSHAQDMLERQYFAHRSPEGKTVKEPFPEVGGHPDNGAAANILLSREIYLSGFTYSEVEKVQSTWMYSQDHRDKILEPGYTRFGFGIATHPASGRLYAVQLLASYP